MKILIWGTGYFSDLLLEFGLKFVPSGYIESQKSKEEFHGKKVYCPSELSNTPPRYDAIIIANKYSEEIYFTAQAVHLEIDKLIFMCPGEVPSNTELAKDILSEYNYEMYLMSRGLTKHSWYDAKGIKKEIYPCSYGNVDNTPVIILRRHNAYTGLFSDFGIFLLYSIEAMKKGYIPVIDRRDVANVTYQEREFYGKENAWEYFFYQPANVTLEEVETGHKNVACWNVQNAEEQYEFPDLVDGNFPNHVIIEYQKIAKKLFRYKDDVRNYVEITVNKYLGDKNRVLGVSVREGYGKSFALNTALGENHRIQPSLQTYLEDIENFMENWKLDHIFLACEAQETANAFKEKFGDKVILYPRNRFTYQKVPATLYDIGENYNQIDKRQHCLDYIIEIECLAHCTSLVCGSTSGNNIAMILKDGLYEHIYCYDLGKYHYEALSNNNINVS